jgi:hypothetical protein
MAPTTIVTAIANQYPSIAHENGASGPEPIDAGSFPFGELEHVDQDNVSRITFPTLHHIAQAIHHVAVRAGLYPGIAIDDHQARRLVYAKVTRVPRLSVGCKGNVPACDLSATPIDADQ